MKISEIFNNLIGYLFLLLLMYIFFYILYALGVGINRDGIQTLFEKDMFLIIAILVTIFSFFVAYYIRLTKKDIQMLKIMEGLHERTEGYRGLVAFWEGMGPMGIGISYLDHGGFFLLPFVQRRKNYRDIDVKKIPFKKKFPFILFFISTFSVPVFGLIAWAIN